MKVAYTIPKLCKAQKGWYIHYRFNGKQKRIKSGLNYYKDLKEREDLAKLMIAELTKRLKNGYNPFNEQLVVKSKVNFIDALDFALDKRKQTLAKKTYLGYRSTVKIICDTIKLLSLDYLFVDEVKRVHIKTIIEKSKELRQWSDKAYNKNLNYLSAVMSELIQWDIIEHNPVNHIKRLYEEESNYNRPATSEEQKIITDYLKSNHINFFNYVSFIYHCGIRPNEVRQIKLSMIDLNNRTITLTSSITKTKKERVIPINIHLFNELIKLDIHKYPKDYYLFGSNRVSKLDNIYKRKSYIIGRSVLKRGSATKLWKKLIKDGLGINVNLYSEKHKGANDKILAGIDLDALRELYGHKSKMMTMRYAKGIKDVYRKEIMDKSPEF